MSIESRVTNLPTDSPSMVIGGISNYRWGIPAEPGPAVPWVTSIQAAIERESLDAWVVIADETNTPHIGETRVNLLNRSLESVSSIAPFFLLTPETQTTVADLVEKRTGFSRVVVDAILNNGGYANQRTKLDALIGGIAIGQHPINLLSLDDDIVIPHNARQIREDKLPRGIHRLPNSQVLFRFDGDDDDLNWFELADNHLAPMFRFLGKTIEEIRQVEPEFQAKVHIADTMQEALERAVMEGHAQFQVTFDNEDEDIPPPMNITIVAEQAIKSKKPDYVASRVAAGHLMAEFPAAEIPIYAYPSGQHIPFAIASADSNIDSGTLSRYIDDQTARWPWWFVSDRTISQRNPLKVVTGQYRADNDFLPLLLKRIYKRTGRQTRTAYVGGVETQLLHSRASTGYRQDSLEQACASAVGKIPAYEAMNHLKFDTDSQAHLDTIPDSYQAPRDHTRRVYELLYNLGRICIGKIGELDARKQGSGTNTEDIDRKIRQYVKIYKNIFNKLAEFDHEEFARHLDLETRDQLRFYATILEAMPRVLTEVSGIIKEGKYPVVEIYRRN